VTAKRRHYPSLAMRLYMERRITRSEYLQLTLDTSAHPRPCLLCGGVGSIDGFWLGTTKTCTSCHGTGRQ